MPDPKEIRKNGQDIYTVNFAQYLPESLKKDPKIPQLSFRHIYQPEGWRILSCSKICLPQ